MILAIRGVEGAYEKVRGLATRARDGNRRLIELALDVPELKKEIEGFTDEQTAVLYDPNKYTGQSRQRALAVAAYWEKENDMMSRYLSVERDTIHVIRSERFTPIVEEIRRIEQGAEVPEDFCPAEDRKKMIERWITEQGA